MLASLSAVEQALIAGIAAGFGVAVPVGAAAVLLVDIAVKRGFVRAATGGLGIALGDGAFALVAAVAGALLARLLAPVADWFSPVSAVVLIVLALIEARRFPWSGPVPGTAELAADLSEQEAASPIRTLAVFFAGTIAHPSTVVFFVSLILGLSATGEGLAENLVFAAGASVASLAWQLALAAAGAALRRPIGFSLRRAVLVADLALLIYLVFTILDR